MASTEGITALWEKFSLTESEGDRYEVVEEKEAGEFFLAAKFFTKRTLSMEAIARTFKMVWKARKSFEVRDMGNHLVLFTFEDESDVVKVLQGEPWSFDKYLVSL